MYTALKNSLSPLSAEEDEKFHLHFIETKYLKRLISNESDIVYGTKGVGKTALRKALTEINGDYYYKTITIDLDSISFEAVYKKLTDLNKTVDHEMHTLSRTTWKNTLLNYALLSFSETLKPNDLLAKRIREVLEQDKFISSDSYTGSDNSNYRILNTIENIIDKIISLPFAKHSISNSSLTPEQQNIVHKFPLNDKISSILKDAIELIRISGKKVLVCVDGFDSILKHSADSREAIFAGLIDAIYFFRLDRNISEVFCFKAFLPQELTLEANMITWDTDKHSNNIHYLSWSENDFKLFIERRFSPFTKKKSTKFSDAWTEFFPDKIINSVHNIEENTFDYILRHTLYRPRQVLNHIYNIIRSWDEETTSTEKIQPSFIPREVAKSNKLMANQIAENLSKIYPSIISFLKSWQSSSSIVEVVKFRERINRHFKDLSTEESLNIDKIFDDLFDFGIFGICKKPSSRAIGKKVEARFAFVGDNINTSIHSSISDDDWIAFSPMFREYCGCQQSLEGIIIPIAMDNFD